MGAERAGHRKIYSHDVNRQRRMHIGWRGRGRGFAVIIPIPREATSVATMIGLLPVLNSLRTQSRSFCCLSPWIAKKSLAGNFGGV